MKERLHLYHCAGICDADHIDQPDAAILLSQRGPHLHILALGNPRDVQMHPAAAVATRIHLPHAVLIPALVNAHTHLDLTHLGPLPYDPAGGFVAWVDRLRAGRCTHPDDLRRAVQHGIDLSLAGAVIAVGDIAGAGRPEPLETLRQSPLRGVSFLEVFGIGPRQPVAIQALRDACDRETGDPGQVRLGLQPHATYSAGLDVFAAALDLRDQCATPVCTHLAETSEERDFVAHARGDIRCLLERLGAWDDSILQQIGHGLHPVAHLEPILARKGLLVAHVNDCPDDALERLARHDVSVAYCPRCSAYFGHADTFGPHRYRDMLAAGINVALGTDSIINLPDANRLSTLDEMRFLHRRDDTDPAHLLRMATINGARALGLDENLFRLRPGNLIAGLAAVDITAPGTSPRRMVVASTGGIRLLHPQATST